jgi:hypothetical protein
LNGLGSGKVQNILDNSKLGWNRQKLEQVLQSDNDLVSSCINGVWQCSISLLPT